MCDDVFAALEAALKPMNTTKDVAECGITERTLAYWRTTGLGPKYVKVGRTVLYPKEELVSHFREHLYQSTMEYGEVPA